MLVLNAPPPAEVLAVVGPTVALELLAPSGLALRFSARSWGVGGGREVRSCAANWAEEWSWREVEEETARRRDWRRWGRGIGGEGRKGRERGEVAIPITESTVVYKQAK